MSSSSAQNLRQAEALKATIADSGTGTNEAWVSRQSLQDLYQKLLIVDLEFALNKKVEQDLWNHAFKNQINLLQGQSKDRQNPKRNEIQASLQLFLQTASGFYLQLLQEICSVFHLDLPFRRKSSYLGILKESKLKIRTPERGSCLYICQHCLVHLGDIARYRQQIEQAQTYYRHAAVLVPFNGQPYNQLAILETAKGNKLSTVFFYIRSIAVKHPFPVASTNLEKLYAKLSKEILEYRGKLSMSEIVMAFLQFHALVHLHRDFERARKLSEKLLSSLPTHITSMSFSSYQLIQMVAINLYSMHHQKRLMESGATSKGKSKDVNRNTQQLQQGQLKEEEKAFSLVFCNTVSFLDNLLYHTPKQEHKAKEYHTLPAIKVVLDWLRLDRSLLCKPAFKNSTIWPSMSKLLNNLQFLGGAKETSFNPDKYAKTALPEEVDLQCFLAIHKSYSHLDFDKLTSEELTPEIETRLRCHQLVNNGVWITEQFPSLNLINVQKLVSGRYQFSAPTAQIKVLTGGENEPSQEKRSCRQNVAIQAIMQNRATKKNVNTTQNTEPSTVKEVTLLNAQHKKQKAEEINAAVEAFNSPEEWPRPGPLKPATRPNTINPPAMRNATPGKPSPVQSPTASNPHQQQFMRRCPSPRQVSPHHTQPQPQHSLHNGPKIEQTTPLKSSPQSAMKPAMHHLSPSGHPSMQQSHAMQQQLQQQQQQQQQQQFLGAQHGHHQGQLGGGDIHFKGQHGLPNLGQNIPVPFHMQQVQGDSQFHAPAYVTSAQQPRAHAAAKPTPGAAPAMHNNALVPSNVSQQLHSSPCPSPLSALPLQAAGMFRQPGAQMASSAMRQQQLSSGSQNPNIPRASSNPETFPQTAVLAGIHMQPADSLDNAHMMRAMQQNNNAALHPLAGLHHPLPAAQTQQRHPFMSQHQQQQLIRMPQTRPVGVRAGFRQMVPANYGELPHPSMVPGKQIGYQGDGQEIKISDFTIDVRPRPSSAHPNADFTATSMNFAGGSDEGVPKPDSPPPIAQSLFSQNLNDKNSLFNHAEPGTGTYSLFSQSPWSMNISTAGNGKTNSDASSYGSQSSSLRGTPDPFGDASDNVLQHGNYAGLGYSYGNSDERNWTGAGLSPQRPNRAQTEPTVEGSNTLLSSNIQSIWSSGPSPLERLLEQQKIQRQNDPH